MVLSDYDFAEELKSKYAPENEWPRRSNRIYGLWQLNLKSLKYPKNLLHKNATF